MSEIGLPCESIKVEESPEYIKVKGESHSDEDSPNESLNNADPLFDVSPEEESGRRLRPRRIPLNLYEGSSEDELTHNGRARKKVTPAVKTKKRPKNENVNQIEQTRVALQMAQHYPPKKRVLASIRLDMEEQRFDNAVKVENIDLDAHVIKTEIVTEDELVQQKLLNTLQYVNVDIAEAAIKEEPCDLSGKTPIAAADPLNSPVIDAMKSKENLEGKKNCKFDELGDKERRAEIKKKAFASLRNRWTDMARLRGKAIASIVPDDDDEECSTSLAELKRMLGGTCDVEGNDESSSSDSKVRERLTLTQQRQLRVHKNQAEAQERALRQRIRNMKQRLQAQLMSTEGEWKAEKARKVAEARMKRKKRYEKETTEQRTARKKRENFLHNEGRRRTKTLETVEERAARTARERERLKERMAMETPEKRAARKERERLNRANQKRRRVEKLRTEKSLSASLNIASNNNTNNGNIISAK